MLLILRVRYGMKDAFDKHITEYITLCVYVWQLRSVFEDYVVVTLQS